MKNKITKPEICKPCYFPYFAAPKLKAENLFVEMKNITSLLFLSFLPCLIFSQNYADTILAIQSLALGDSLLSVKEPSFETAINHYKKAKDIYKDLNLWEAYLDAGLKEGNVYLKRSFRNPEKAIAIFDACKTTVNDQEPSLNLALHHHRTGVAYYHLNNYETAIQHYKEALKIRRAHLEENHIDIYRSLFAIGTAYEFFGNYEESVPYLKNALIIIEKLDDKKRLGSLYQRLSESHRKIGDYSQSIQFTRNAIKILETTLGRNSLEVANLINGIGVTYMDQNLTDEALAAYQEAMGIYQSINDEVGIANVYNNFGSIYYLKKEYKKAITNFKKSLTKNKAIKNRDIFHIANNHTNLGLAYDELKAYEQALFHHQKAFSIGRETVHSDYHFSNFVYLLNLGDTYSNQKKYDDALAYFQKAIFTLLPDFRDTAIFKNPNLEAQKSIGDKYNLRAILGIKAKTIAKMARERRHKVLFEEALKTYRLVAKVLDLMREDHTAESSKLFWTEETIPVYEDAIRVCVELFELTQDKAYLKEAFDFSEKSKSIVLLEAMRDSEAKQYAGIPDSLISKEKYLKKKLAEFEEGLFYERQYESPDAKRIEALEKSIFNNTLAYNDLIEQLEKEHPDYHSMKYDMTTAGVAEVQSWLRDSQAMLSYFPGDSVLFTFKIGKNDIEVLSKQINDLDYWVSAFHKSIYTYFLDSDQTPDLYQKISADYTKSAYELYDQLIRPLGALPNDLIIVPGGVLGYVPFEALLFEPVVTSVIDYKAFQYLVKKHTISYSYSATLLREMLREKRQPKHRKLLAFAPTFEVSSNSPILARGVRGELNPLKFNIEEAEAISQLFGGKFYSGEQASIQNFEKEAWKYSLLHFATHGKADDENPHFSFLAFTPTDSTNSLLYVSDLYNQELCADLVTLSACETGIGKLYRGEGIASLARGFSYAGARSIVTTLWSVSDKKMAALMELFYQNLKSGKSKDIALRDAKLDYLKDRDNYSSHPYFWAAAIPIGDMHPVKVEARNWTFWMVSISIIGICILSLFLYKKLKISRNSNSQI